MYPIPFQTGFREGVKGPLGFAGVDQAAQIGGLNGVIYYVNNLHTNANDDHDGTDPLYPLETIAAALANVVSGRGDKIEVAPGTYEENLVVTKDYVTIAASMPGGYARPDIAPTAGIALVNRSQGLVCLGLRFVSEDSDTVRIEGNGFKFFDCVFDGSAGQAATEAALRLWCHATDDSYTASEGLFEDCLIRNSNGYGVAFDVQAALVGVGPTHNVFHRCRFISNVAEDIIALATAAGVYSLQDNLFEGCHIGMGTSKNKATHIDISTNNGATNTGNVFAGCYINDDTVDGTAYKGAGTGSSLIGCYSLDGVIDGSALD